MITWNRPYTIIIMLQIRLGISLFAKLEELY